MPGRANHRNCCGMQHIESFSGPEDQVVASFVREFNNQGVSGNKRLTEVVLNDTQCAKYPTLLKLMADVGFVYVGRWINGGHNSLVNIWHYAPSRQALTSAPFKWEGMTAGENLSGPLSRVEIPEVNSMEGFQGYGKVDLSKPIELENGAPLRLSSGSVSDSTFSCQLAPFKGFSPPAEWLKPVAGRKIDPAILRYPVLYITATGQRTSEYLYVRNVGATHYPYRSDPDDMRPITDLDFEFKPPVIDNPQRHTNA